jgi:hypothetical protein
MDIEWDHDLAQEDIYRLTKGELQDFLLKLGLTYKEEDSVATLRQVGSAIKNIIRKHNTPEVRDAFSKLTKGKIRIEEKIVEDIPDFAKIQDYLIERENIYDNVHDRDNTEKQLNKISEERKVEHQYEQPRFVPAPAMAEHLPLISAGTFNGLQSENPNEFIDKYEIAAKSNNWQNKTKINLFPAHLAGNALAWFAHYTKSREINNWEELKAKFIDTFRPIAQANSLQLVLDKKVQLREQSALNYFLEVLAICRRYDQGISDKQIINYVIQGLQPEICERILNEKTDTIDELESSLRKIELHLGIQKQNREKFQRATGSDVYREGNATRGQYDEHYRGNDRDLKAIETEIKTLTNIVSNLSLRNSRDQVRGTSQERQWRETRSPSWGRGNRFEDRRGYESDRRQNERSWPKYQPREVERRFENPINYRAQRGSFQEARNGAQERRVQFQSPNRRGAQETPRSAFGQRQRGAEKFCSVCKRNNHNTEQCRFVNNNRLRENREMFCRICKLNNHNTENCRRGPQHFQNQKNY